MGGLNNHVPVEMKNTSSRLVMGESVTSQWSKEGNEIRFCPLFKTREGLEDRNLDSAANISLKTSR